MQKVVETNWAITLDENRTWGEEGTKQLRLAEGAELDVPALDWTALQDTLKRYRTRVSLPKHAGFDLWSLAMVLAGAAEPTEDICSEAEWTRGAAGRDWVARATAHAWRERHRKPILTPLESRARSVFLASIRRRGRTGPDFLSAYYTWLAAGGQPETDRFVTGDYAAELTMLELDKEAYLRDLKRAKMFTAYVNRGTDRVVDEGVLVENPESVLFQDWAWRDAETPKEKNGFGVVIVIRDDTTQIAADPAKQLDLSELWREMKSKGAGGGNWRRADPSPNGDHRIADSVYGWWTMWAEGNVDARSLETTVRTHCEGRLFKRGATWQAGPGGHQRLACQVDLECEGKTLRYVSCELDDNLGARFHQAAFHTVARALYDSIRPERDRRPGFPRDFDKHVQGDSGVITVWNREAFAVAYTQYGKQLKDDLRDPIGTLDALLDKSGKLPKHPDDPNGREHYEKQETDLFEEFSKLQAQMTKPGFRLLRRLFEATEQTEVHRARVDVHLATEANNQAAETKNIQLKLEFIELFIVLFYAYEFTHSILRHPIESAVKVTHLHVLEAIIPLVVAITLATLYRSARTFLIGEHKPESDTEAVRRRQLGRRLMIIFFALVISALVLSGLMGWKIDKAERQDNEKIGKLEADIRELRQTVHDQQIRLMNASRPPDTPGTPAKPGQRPPGQPSR